MSIIIYIFLKNIILHPTQTDTGGHLQLLRKYSLRNSANLLRNFGIRRPLFYFNKRIRGKKGGLQLFTKNTGLCKNKKLRYRV